ncbi:MULTISPECIES: PA3611 family quorum-sensing-regulated virulence factor [Pseudomonas]|uniref:PA3611 family quorum-sensing-regulated virulence factor n=1 Tax=Pseudomonas TaxID=286 RepID=UPI001238FFB1|nr:MULTISPECIES: PA3611 family quorum-sensing-regulated virulence factor [Pseudomonas]QIB51273.1 hypothetical protein G3M63_09570 [Pseudomonas sp. OIL-1]
MRWLSLVLALSVVVPAHGASLRDMQLQKMLEEVAVISSEGTPRAINEEITDEGFTVDGTQLVNILSVRPAYAKKLQGDPLVVRTQLQASVCENQRFRRLMDLGATLTYHFVLTGSTQPVLTQRFIAEHCQAL